MQTVENQTAEGITIAMDDKYFLNCQFTRCVLVYSGGDCEWIDTSFPDCELKLIGPALRALGVLQSFGFANDFGSGSPQPSAAPSTFH
jgi:hypothetical protein